MPCRCRSRAALAGFIPFPFAFAGIAALVARRKLAVPVALVAGIVLQRLWPGDFEYGLRHGGPAARDLDRPRRRSGRRSSSSSRSAGRRCASTTRSACAAVCAFVLPVFVHGLAHWSPDPKSDPRALSPRLVHNLRTKVPKGAIVLAPLDASYRVAASAPVYIVAAPVVHVAEHEGERPVRPCARRPPLGPDERSACRQALRRDLGDPQRPPLSSPAVKVLLVTMYFPPAGGGGVQRPLKFATHLPELGIETHVLAPDDSEVDPPRRGAAPPTLAWVHRARYLGPKGRKPAEELHGTTGLERASKQVQLAGRRLLVPDENVSWNLTAIPAAIRIAKREGIDVVVTTSPPSSVHLVGAAVKRAVGIPWVADLRDSVVAHPHREPSGCSCA